MLRKLASLAMASALCAFAALFATGCSAQAPASTESEGFAEVNEPVEEEVTVPDDPFFALLVGNDSRWGTVQQKADTQEDGPTFSDTMMLVYVDPGKDRFSILSIPRDTYTEIDGRAAKVNEVHLQGPEALVKEIEDLTGAKIDYYFDTTFQNFEIMVNDLGGVTVDVPSFIAWQDIVGGGDVALEPGEGQTLNGPEALVYSRMRKNYVDNGEACRQFNARNVVASAIGAITTSSEDMVDVYTDLLYDHSATNMDHAVLKAYFKKFIEKGKAPAVSTGSGPWAGFMDENIQSWYVSRDSETYAALIDAMKSGDDLYEIVPAPDMTTIEQ